jgi:tetratricopeptide (TPR) repeat protein
MKPEILRLRGTIFSALGEMEAADKAYQQALDLSREQGALSLELRCLSSLLAHRRSLHQDLEAVNIDLRRILDCLESQEGRSEIKYARDLLRGIS